MSITPSEHETQELVVTVAKLHAEFESVLKHSFSEIGRVLQKAMDTLPRGEYETWIAAKGISRTTAWRYRKIYADPECFKVKHCKLNDLLQIEGPDGEAKHDGVRVLDLFGDSEDEVGDDGEDEPETKPPLGRGVHQPETNQRGNEQVREAKREYNQMQPSAKAEAMATAKPVVKDAPKYQAVCIVKPEIGDRKDYIGDEFLIDYIGDLMEQARDKGYAQELKDMFYARGVLQRKVTV